MKNLMFYTINPHYKDYYMEKLLDKFQFTLQKYYRKTLGPRYNLKKSEQFQLYIFPEETTNIIKEPHLHIVIDIPKDKRAFFFAFMNKNLKETYRSLTYNIQQPKNTKTDYNKLISYCSKEDKVILGKEDLW